MAKSMLTCQTKNLVVVLDGDKISISKWRGANQVQMLETNFDELESAVANIKERRNEQS